MDENICQPMCIFSLASTQVASADSAILDVIMLTLIIRFTHAFVRSHLLCLDPTLMDFLIEQHGAERSDSLSHFSNDLGHYLGADAALRRFV